LYQNCLLLEEQKQLLEHIVEAYRNVRSADRRIFLFIELTSNSSINHPGLPEGTIKAYKGDIETLAREDLINLTYGNNNIIKFDINPLGFKYYEKMKAKQSIPVQRIEETVMQYLHADQFKKKYSKSYKKWETAEALLWSSDSQKQLTTIGHLCREALQEFADQLILNYKPSDVNNDKSKTVSRIRSVLNLNRNKFGNTEREFLEALLNYWGTVSDLVQRQEHGAQREGSELVWEDGRRIVFQIAILIMEIDKSLSLIQ
jgi:hypothetical protein